MVNLLIVLLYNIGEITSGVKYCDVYIFDFIYDYDYLGTWIDHHNDFQLHRHCIGTGFNPDVIERSYDDIKIKELKENYQKCALLFDKMEIV